MYLGSYPVNGTVDFKWNTNGQDGASITRSTNGSIRIYKDNSTTERSSSAGITDTEDFDTVTGVHHLRIDLSDNTDAGFYVAASEYQVVLQGATIDTKSVSAVIAHFSIERSGSTLAGIRKNRALNNFQFAMVSSADHFSPKTTLVNGDFSAKEQTIDGAAAATLSGTITEVAFGVYKVNLTAGELNGDVITFHFKATGADDTTITIKTTP